MQNTVSVIGLFCKIDLCFRESIIEATPYQRVHASVSTSYLYFCLYLCSASVTGSASVTVPVSMRANSLQVSYLQCVAMCCSVLQCIAVYFSVLQCVAACGSSKCTRHLGLSVCAVCCSVLQCVAVCCSSKCTRHLGLSVFVAVCCSVFQCVSVCCSVLQCVAAQKAHGMLACLFLCSVLQCIAVCCAQNTQGMSACLFLWLWLWLCLCLCFWLYLYLCLYLCLSMCLSLSL